MKTSIKLILFCSSFLLTTPIFASGRNTTAPQNPALPPSDASLPTADPAIPPVIKQNPAQPAQNPAQPAPNPALPTQTQNPALPVQNLNPALPPLPAQPPQQQNPATPIIVRPPAPQQPAPTYPAELIREQQQGSCEITQPQAIHGAWNGYVDWSCGRNPNPFLHPIKWFFDAQTRTCCTRGGQQPPEWRWKFDGPYFMLFDNRLGGAVFQGAFNGFNVLQGYVYYANSVGCWQITRMTPPPVCNSNAAPQVPAQPQYPFIR